MNVYEHLGCTALLFPDHIALVSDQQRWTYRQLDDLVRIASQRLLREFQIQQGERIVILFPNTVDFIVWYFAGLRIGAIVVSASTRLTPEEVNYIATDCDAKLLIGYEEFIEAYLQSISQPVDTFAFPYGQNEPGRLESVSGAFCDWAQTDPNDPAVILYTSGTTGFPKGATLSHQNVRSTVHSFNHLCQMKAGDRSLCSVPLFHCYGQNALMNSIFNTAGTLVLQKQFDLLSAKELIQSEQVNLLFGVPMMFQLFFDSCTPHELQSIEYCFSAATTLPLDLSLRWQKKYGLPIYEGYGLTETSPFASYNHRSLYRPGSIGTPVDLVEMKVVDPETGTQCLPGELGELVIRGPNVMLGYWNRPEETASAIRDGWFHSGDIGRLDEQGYYYIVDRVKDMISVGGIKVFPAEVERVLFEHDGVVDVAVVGGPDKLLGENVCSFVVRAGTSEHSDSEFVTELKQWCQTRMASYKVPTRVEIVDQLPRNPAGKVLKRVLRDTLHSGQFQQIGQASSLQQPADVAVSSSQTKDQIHEQTEVIYETETSFLMELKPQFSPFRKKQITAFLKQQIACVSGLSDQPADDEKLFEYGLDSLMMIDLKERIQKSLGTAIGLSETVIFEYPTVAALTGYLEQKIEQLSSQNLDSTEDQTHADQSDRQQLLQEIEQFSEEQALAELLKELES